MGVAFLFTYVLLNEILVVYFDMYFVAAISCPQPSRVISRLPAPPSLGFPPSPSSPPPSSLSWIPPSLPPLDPSRRADHSPIVESSGNTHKQTAGPHPRQHDWEIQIESSHILLKSGTTEP